MNSNNFDAGLLFNLNYTWSKWMLIAVGLGIALGLWRRLFQRPSQAYEAQRGTIKRHVWPIVIAHWGNAIGFLLALYSGAALIRVVPSSLTLASLYHMHYVGLTLMLLSLLSIITYQFVYGGHSFRTTGVDVRNAFIELVAYIGLIGDEGFLGYKVINWPVSWRRSIEKTLGADHHSTGKYLPVEKVLSLIPWIVVTTLIVITGLIKGLHYLIPMPVGLLQRSTAIHDFGVYAGALMLFFHAGATLIVRTNWPLFGSMFTSRVSVQYAKERHPKWFEEVMTKAMSEEQQGDALAAVAIDE